MICYFDTSALVKLWLEEEDGDEVDALWWAATARVTSVISYAESRAALAAATRANRLTRSGLAEAKATLEAHWGELEAVQVDEALVRFAGDVAERERLRGLDALHLASALEGARGGTLTFVTWDIALRRAARRVGLAVPA